MEEINKIIGKNLLILRKKSKLTQLELADKFNYSDKTISKWENGESLPGIDVLYDIASFYGVTLNDLTNDNLDITPNSTKQKRPRAFSTHLMITLLSVCCVWLFATTLFVVLMLAGGIIYPLCFLWAIPASCIVLIVFNSLWGKYRFLFIILTVMLWTAITCLHLQILANGLNLWPLYLVGIPLQFGIILWGALVKRPTWYIRQQKEEKISKAKQKD